MDSYICTVCGYVYDPAQGDPDSGVAAGTSFEDIPDDWVCPVCGADKDQFEKECNISSLAMGLPVQRQLKISGPMIRTGRSRSSLTRICRFITGSG